MNNTTNIAKIQAQIDAEWPNDADDQTYSSSVQPDGSVRWTVRIYDPSDLVQDELEGLGISMSEIREVEPLSPYSPDLQVEMSGDVESFLSFMDDWSVA